MKKVHDGIHSFAGYFLPDLHHLPSSWIAKNLLFFLGVFGFWSMFRNQVSANTNISTSLSNNVMTIETLLVTNNGLPSGSRVVRLWSAWLQINLGAPSGVLKMNWSNYITQWQVVGWDIANNTIDSTKIQNNAITNVKLADNSITNTKIVDGEISCSKLNLTSFPGMSCTGSTVTNGSCPPWQYVQWVTTTWGIICAPGWGTIVCWEWQVLQVISWVRTCVNPPSSAWGSGFWDSSNLVDIYNINAGNVGIWLTNPTAKLSVSWDVLVNGNGTINTGALWSGVIGSIWATATPNANAILYVWNGKVGILTSNPTYTLDVVGTIRAASIITSSDARLKSNIKVIDNALTALLGINGYAYTLKSDWSKQYWVLAQEVENIFPYIVSTDNAGYKAVNYNGLIAPIIQAIHELDAKVQSLEAKYQSNESRINALEKKLSK